MLRVALVIAIVVGTCGALAQAPANPAIDMDGFLRVAAQAADHRVTRRVSEQQFLRMRDAPDTIVVDARSRDKFDELHVAGAVNLPFADIAVESLRRTVPDPATTILIYCNNNFVNADGPFPTKLPAASLNLSTYVALYTYGYRNVYELGPLIDVERSVAAVRRHGRKALNPGRNARAC